MRTDDLKALLREGVSSAAASSGSASSGSGPAGECPDDEDLAAFVEGTLGAGGAAGLREHLAGCDRCLERVGFLARLADGPAPAAAPSELVDRVRKAAAGGGTASGPPWRWAAAAAAAALLLVVSVRELGEPPPPEVRSVVETAAAPEIVRPEEGAVVDRTDGLEIRWTPVRGALYYELRLVAADGRRLYDARAEGDRLTLPAAIRLVPGGEHYLWVRAYLPEGKTLQSPMVGFRASGEPPER